MNKEKFIETWETMDDEMRCRWLSKISEQKYIPMKSIMMIKQNYILIILVIICYHICSKQWVLKMQIWYK